MSRTQLTELFTSNWAVTYDKWVLSSEAGIIETYTRGNFTIKINRPWFVLLVQIFDKNGKQVMYRHISTVAEYRYLTKKIKGWK